MCDSSKCDGKYLHVVQELFDAFPKLFGGIVPEATTGDIELFLSRDDSAYRKRDRELDGTLSTNTRYSLQSAPCKFAIYYNAQNDILKSLIYVDSSLPSENVESCIEADVAYAVGAYAAGDTKVPFSKLSAKEHRTLRTRFEIGFMFQTAFAGLPATYKDVKETLFEAFSLPASDVPSSP